MFAKLLKHEFSATGRLMNILSIVMLATSLVATVLLRLLLSLDRLVPDDAPDFLLLSLSSSLSILLGACAVLAVTYCIGTIVILLIQFYRSKFTDQGYLTFTLPAGTRDILLSSYLNALIWLVIGAAVTILSVLIVALFGSTTEGLINIRVCQLIRNAFQGFWGLLTEYGKLNVFDMILFLIHGIVSGLSGLMLYFAVITLGCTLAKNHRVLVCIALYYGISTVLNTLNGSVQVIFGIYSAAVSGNEVTFAAIYIPQTVLMAGVLAGGYFLSTYLMKNKLNLP